MAMESDPTKAAVVNLRKRNDYNTAVSPNSPSWP
jgi:hypothetical protein